MPCEAWCTAWICSVSHACRITRLDGGLPLNPGESVTFAPGGYHLMLIGLPKATKAGDVIPATFIFASGARLKVEFPVGGGPNAMPGMDMGHMKH